MTYIFDECVSHKLVDIMKQLGVRDICHITELWPLGTNDEIFLPEIGKRGNILITVDPTMRHTRGKHGHLAILKQYHVKVLFLPGMFFNARAIVQASWMIDHWETILKGVKDLPNLALARILSNGKIEPIP